MSGRKKMRVLLGISALLLALLVPARQVVAGTIVIKPDGSGDYPTIQAGLDATASGDTVLVSAGMYMERLFWPPRNGIVLIGAGMDSTIVVGDQVETVAYIVGTAPIAKALTASADAYLAAHPNVREALAFAVPIDSTTVVRGLRFRNGGVAGVVCYTASPLFDSCAVDSTRLGRGVHCLYASAMKIRACQIEENLGSGIEITDCDSLLAVTGNMIAGNTASEGGGIHCSYSSPMISNNTITQNTGWFGGGIYCYNFSIPMISNNTITDNTAPGSGGGIYCDSSTPTISNNAITGNVASSNGGGIYCDSSTPTISNNAIRGNAASSNGGGIYCVSSSPGISSNVIIGNTASFYGGGICCSASSPMISNNMIIANMASAGGGIICLSSSSPTIASNTIARNTALSDGGGISSGVSSPTISNNTITRNVAGAKGGALYCSEGSPLVSRNTITENRASDLGDAIYTRETLPIISCCNIAYNGWGVHNASYASVPVVRDNWWGAPLGPWHQAWNPLGQGDSLSTYAWDFVPWLAAADTLAPPIPPVNLRAAALSCSETQVTWDAVPLPDLAGYRVYFDTDAAGFPYEGMIDVGNLTQDTLPIPVCSAPCFLAVTAYDRSGDESWYSEEVLLAQVQGTSVSGTPPDELIPSVRLGSGHPNPFSSSTTIDFALSGSAYARLMVFDVEGRLVTTLVDDVLGPGMHTVEWNGSDLAGTRVSPGVYLVRLESGRETRSRKIVLAW